jgi:tetratricopeptide (TPR) repeat protein
MKETNQRGNPAGFPDISRGSRPKADTLGPRSPSIYLAPRRGASALRPLPGSDRLCATQNRRCRRDGLNRRLMSAILSGWKRGTIAQRWLQTASAIAISSLLASGCQRAPSATSAASTSVASTPAGQTEQGQFRAPLLQNALYDLNKLEEFDQEPALEQVVDRLNQWSRSQEIEVAWKADPLIATLPKPLADGTWFDRLEDKSYSHELDADFLKEATWLRDIANKAHGRDDLDVAQSLFDWTIRNIQLIEPPSAKQEVLSRQLSRRLPADVLLQGGGTAIQRAWVFILLGRQRQLDIAMLAVADPDHPDQTRPWLPALVHDGQLYLFDTSLGLPIPGPGGKGIATLAQAAEDESVLNRLDLDEGHHYPVKAAEAKQVTAFIEASPGYLARRMKVLETQLAGDESVILTASPQQIAERLKGIAHLAPDVKLWPVPHETYALRQHDDDSSPATKNLKDRLAAEMVPFKVPGYHGGQSTVLKPGQRLQAFDELVRQGENPDEKRVRAVTPGVRGANSRVIFNVRNEAGGNLEHVEIRFEYGSGVEQGHETVQYDTGNSQQPKLIFRIAEGKTTANDILRTLASDPVASQIFEAFLVEQNGEGLIDKRDSTTASRVTLPRPKDIGRPVNIVFPLWAGRLLHFRGVYDGESGAKHFYMLARPGNDEVGQYIQELINDDQEANRRAVAPAVAQLYGYAVVRRKQDSTYWLGLISFDEGQYEAAKDYFSQVSAETSRICPSPWIAAAHYNLARTCEAAGETAEAIKLLEEDTNSPQYYGNRLRARRLKEAAGDKHP